MILYNKGDYDGGGNDGDDDGDDDGGNDGSDNGGDDGGNDDGDGGWLGAHNILWCRSLQTVQIYIHS